MTFNKQERKRSSAAMQLLGANLEVASEIDVPVSKGQNVAQLLKPKPKINPIGYIEITENKKKDFSRCIVEKARHQLVMVMDDSTTR